MDPAKCVVLVPANYGIEDECEDSLRLLEKRGYEVRRIRGFASIDQGRNQMASNALADGFDELMWLDADTKFHPDDLERLRAHPQSIVSGIYAKKGSRELASCFLPQTKSIVFGQGGGLIEILYAATGFLLTRRQAYDDIQQHWSLPVCNRRFNRPVVPYFMPLIAPDEGEHWYLANDFAFCHRARAAGHKVYADTTLRLGHIGKYTYFWEEAGSDPQRYQSYTYQLS